jgi:hypothetical protein
LSFVCADDRKKRQWYDDVCVDLVSDGERKLFIANDNTLITASASINTVEGAISDEQSSSSTKPLVRAPSPAAASKTKLQKSLPLSPWLVRTPLVSADTFLNDTFTRCLELDTDFARYAQVRVLYFFF